MFRCPNLESVIWSSQQNTNRKFFTDYYLTSRSCILSLPFTVKRSLSNCQVGYDRHTCMSQDRQRVLQPRLTLEYSEYSRQMRYRFFGSSVGKYFIDNLKFSLSHSLDPQFCEHLRLFCDKYQFFYVTCDLKL
jgi:hypothetical protein